MLIQQLPSPRPYAYKITYIQLITCTYVLVFSEKECSYYEFNCGNGTCINKTRLCDGIDDCKDNGADEDDCGTFEII